jgi:hypothetical protein
MNTWDAKPQYVDYHGLTLEAFYRSALAKALNRTLSGIRTMERNGVLCHPALKDGRQPPRWLYTRDQIEDLVRLAEEEGVIDPRYRRPFSPYFIASAHQILKRLPR